MLVVLAIAGAIIVFAAGWALCRALSPIDQFVGSGGVLPVVRAQPQPSPQVGIEDLLDDHKLGAVLISANGDVVYRNATVRRLAGTHVGVLLDEAIERHGDRARRGESSTETIEMYGPPRTVLVVEARPVRSGGSVVFVDDISERRRMDQVRTDFVANISHELKTPVGALSVLAETLEGERDPETIARVVARMLAEAERAARTIDDLMELSRIELGGEREVEPITIDEIVAGALERVEELGVQRGIGVSTLDPVAPDGRRPGAIRVLGDRRQLVSAVGNLVENAVKYSHQGGTVQVRVTQTGDRVEIAVADQGVGIPQRDLDRIFERFYRVDRARSRATGGTGLGLSIVRHVATNHGGEVRVASTEGEGSTFVLRLPIGEPAAADGDDDVGGLSCEGVA
jgi:two-component system, OmpR family, sensor histidine kinase SenX3